MKRTQTVIVDQAKRQRLFLRFNIGPLIKPFVDAFPDLQPPFPSLNDQNVLYDLYDNIYKIREIKHLITKEMTPFVTLTCSSCGGEKMLHYFPFFKNNVSGTRYSQKLPRECQACKSIKINQKNRTEYSEEEKKQLLAVLQKKVQKAHRDNSDLNMALMFKKCQYLVTKGVKQSLDILLECDIAKQYKCNTCKEMKYIYEFRTDIKCRNSIRPKCTPCSVKNSTEIRVIAGMKERMQEGTDICVHSVYQDKMDAQNKRCFYSLFPFETEHGHPFKASPERIVRNNPNYTPDNVVLVLNILNVGGRRNFSRKLIMQSIIASKFDIVFGKYDTKSSERFLKSALNSARQRAEKRAENEIRTDNSHCFTLTYADVLCLLEEQEYRCKLSKIPLVPQWGHAWSLSFDRIDPSDGYIKKNVRFVIARYNAPKTWTRDLATSFFGHIEENKEELLDLYNKECHTNFVSFDDPLLIDELREVL